MRENFRSKIQFNKQIILRLITIFLISQILFCASAKRYVVNRGNDLTDIINIGIEKDVYGVNTSFGLPLFGYASNRNGTGFGIRHGHLGFYKTGDDKNPVIFKDKAGTILKEHYMGNNFLDFTGYHEPLNSKNDRANSKKYMYIESANIGLKCSEATSIFIYYKNRKATCKWLEGAHYSPVELSLGLYLGIRIGFNWGEIFDFAFGIFGFDTMDDDFYNANGTLPKLHGWSARGVTTIIPIDEKYLPKPLEKKDWESKLDALDEKMDKRLTK